jgi:hypothetical protein
MVLWLALAGEKRKSTPPAIISSFVEISLVGVKKNERRIKSNL